MGNEQEFSNWIEVKINVHHRGLRFNFNEGEIWWCAVGKNVGVEINGKSETFARPVIVLHKFNRHSFMAIPLTSRKYIGTWYVNFRFQGVEEYAVLSQARVVSASRLYKRIGRMDENDVMIVRRGFCNLFCK